MSGRCIGCNSILTEEDLKRKWYSSQEYTNLCYYCFDKANDILDYQVAVTLANQKEMLLTMNLLQSQLYSLQTQQAVTLHRLRHTSINTT